ncbi:HxlR family transcriptional regulator [Streptomyces sp. AA4]|nr:HxlR family transcriptional regulator [Streptomyces sp. AA4]
MEFIADCRTRLAFDLVANTWHPVVLWTLKNGPLRHGELRTRIGGISAKVLTEAVRKLERDGLVERADGAYQLTELGVSFLGPIEGFGRWAAEYGDQVLEAQLAHEGNGLARASSSSGTAAAASVTSVETSPDRSTASTASAFGWL